MEAHPGCRHLIEHARANCRLETAGKDVGGAGTGHGKNRQRRPGAGHRCDRQRIPAVDVESVQRTIQHHRSPAPARRAQEFLDEQRIAARPGAQLDRVDHPCLVGNLGADQLTHPLDVEPTEPHQRGHTP